jgi:hypothetical protein
MQPYPQAGYSMYRPSPPQQQQQHQHPHGAYYAPVASPYGAYPPGSYPYGFAPPPQPFPEMTQGGDQQPPPPWTSPQAQHFDNRPLSSPPPKKRRNWDIGSGSSSPEGDFKKEAAPMQSPFRSTPEKSASKVSIPEIEN